jgi:hypothetical protein
MTNAKQSLHEHLASHPSVRRLFEAWIEERVNQLRADLEHCADEEIPNVRAELRATRQLGATLKSAKKETTHVGQRR